jgi:hypothetical protein
MVTSIWVLSSLMATPHVQLRHLLHHDDNKQESSPLLPQLRGEGTGLGQGSGEFKCFEMLQHALDFVANDLTFGNELFVFLLNL